MKNQNFESLALFLEGHTGNSYGPELFTPGSYDVQTSYELDRQFDSGTLEFHRHHLDGPIQVIIPAVKMSEWVWRELWMFVP